MKIRHVISKLLKSNKKATISRLNTTEPMLDGLDQESRRIINLLNHTKISGETYSGEKYPIGYHTIILGQNTLKGQRNPQQRLANVPFDFKNKTVLDLGCNQGGMLHALAKEIKAGYGVDYDARMINVANRIKSYSNNNNLNFYVFDLEKENLAYLQDFIESAKVDICFLLSICMWLKNWKEIITFSKSISDKMLFESNGKPEQQKEQIDFLTTLYKNVVLINKTSDDDALQKNRQLLLCNDK
ncbi:MAG: class I SAM-dependent methyltransferase [Clostridia bacterium]|nr:class I SAM-dependent methyltransferase [Clostridia bacterium]